jgi:hypothetical protein
MKNKHAVILLVCAVSKRVRSRMEGFKLHYHLMCLDPVRIHSVFDGASPSLPTIVSVIDEELLGSFAGAKGVSFLLAQAPAAT